MLGTLAGITLAVTAASAYRNKRQWDAYHRAHISRTKLVNGVFATLVAGAATIVMFIFR